MDRLASDRALVGQLLDEGVHPQVFLDVLAERGALTTWNSPLYRCYRLTTGIPEFRVDM